MFKISLTSGLTLVVKVRPSSWAPWDLSKQWLEIISDMAQWVNQCRLCIRSCFAVHLLLSSFYFFLLSKWSCEVVVETRICWCNVNGFANSTELNCSNRHLWPTAIASSIHSFPLFLQPFRFYRFKNSSLYLLSSSVCPHPYASSCNSDNVRGIFGRVAIKNRRCMFVISWVRCVSFLLLLSRRIMLEIQSTGQFTSNNENDQRWLAELPFTLHEDSIRTPNHFRLCSWLCKTNLL